MAGNFNIRNSNWNLLYSFHSFCSDFLVEIVESFDLMLSLAIQQVSTRYSNNANNYEIHPELWFSSDHASLTINKKEFILRRKHTIIKNSEKKSEFMEYFTRRFGSINTTFIADKNALKSIVQKYTDIAKMT